MDDLCGLPPPPPRPTSRTAFEIAIICVLPLEYDAVLSVLDGRWNDDGDVYGKVACDQNVYTTGWIGQHNVVLALCSDMGKLNAAGVAAGLGMSWDRVKVAFLVGICGAVPLSSDGRDGDGRGETREIVLGDVIVSQQVLEYDFGRRYEDALRQKDKLAPGAAGHEARRYMKTVQTEHYRRLIPEHVAKCLRKAQEMYPGKYNALMPSDDKLFASDYRHKHRASAGCDVCNGCIASSYPVCEAAMNSTCEELGCDESRLVHRSRLDVAKRIPMVHWGVIASGDTVMKSASDRDAIAKAHNVIGFEMEGAGVIDSFPCIIVKGACDYADSHKSKKWQDYAAITAACVMKVLLKWYPRTDQPSRVVDQGAISIVQAQQFEIKKHPVDESQQENEDLRIQVRELKAQLQQQRALPAQIHARDLVSVNDALGQTYSFPLTFVDSLEFFVTILKHKFKDVGVDKVERGEWLLQNRRTGHVLNLNRPWKAVVKPGQMLDMSMIFRKRNTLSTQCPWCNSENETDSQDQYTECQNCAGKYHRIKEVYKIVGVADDDTQQRDPIQKRKSQPSTQPPTEPPASSPMPPKEQQSDDEEIHLYTRVQIIDIELRFSRPGLGVLLEKTWEHRINIGPQDLTDLARLAQRLTKDHHLPEQDVMDALMEHYDDNINHITTPNRQRDRSSGPIIRRRLSTDSVESDNTEHREQSTGGPAFGDNPSEASLPIPPKSEFEDDENHVQFLRRPSYSHGSEYENRPRPADDSDVRAPYIWDYRKEPILPNVTQDPTMDSYGAQEEFDLDRISNAAQPPSNRDAYAPSFGKPAVYDSTRPILPSIVEGILGWFGMEFLNNEEERKQHREKVDRFLRAYYKKEPQANSKME